MKYLIRGFVGLVVALAIAIALLWTPDTSREAMVAQYAGGASRFLTLASGDRIHYRDQGLRTGQPLVFIHGTSASLHTWEPLIEELADEYRLLSFDLPGHGLTGAMKNRDYSQEAMSDALWTLMDHLGIPRATLVGNSLGGRIAWMSALDHPERVSALVLLAPSGAPRLEQSDSNIGFKLLGTRIGRAAMRKVTPRFIIKASLQQTVADKDLVSNSMVDRYWQLLRMEGNRQAMLDLSTTPRETERWRELNKIGVPSLVIWGTEDGILPVSMADTFDSEIPNVQMVRLKGVGHLPMEEAVDTVAQLIQSHH